MADRFPKDNSYPEVPFGNVGLWPGAGVPLPNFIAREKSLRGHVLTGRFWASISESWRTRLGQERMFIKARSTPDLGLKTDGIAGRSFVHLIRAHPTLET